MMRRWPLVSQVAWFWCCQGSQSETSLRRIFDSWGVSFLWLPQAEHRAVRYGCAGSHCTRGRGMAEGWERPDSAPAYSPEATLRSELHPQGDDSPFLMLIGYPKEGWMKIPPFFFFFFLISSWSVLSKWWKWSRSFVFGSVRPHGP